MGITKIETAFETAKREGRAALMPYFSLGYPTPQTSLEIVRAIAKSGADLIELGLPFSDPLADGPTIQRSTQIALEQGATVQKCLEMVVELRSSGVEIPIILMGYFNPIFNYGVEKFTSAAAQAGADGFIIPDLPIHEAGEMEAACQTHNLALVAMLAPTSTETRMREACQHASGFIYLVSLTGVTGGRKALPPDLADFVNRVRQFTKVPLAVGFGISTPDQAATVGQIADGVIVGSAIIQAGADGDTENVKNFVRALKHAIKE